MKIQWAHTVFIHDIPVLIFMTFKHFWLFQCIWYQYRVTYPLSATDIIVYGHRTSGNSTQPNDCPYRIKRIGLCLVLLIFCQTKSDCQHRFTNHPVQLFFSDIESRDSISASALSETFYPVWTIIGRDQFLYVLCISPKCI